MEPYGILDLMTFEPAHEGPWNPTRSGTKSRWPAPIFVENRVKKGLTLTLIELGGRTSTCRGCSETEERSCQDRTRLHEIRFFVRASEFRFLSSLSESSPGAPMGLVLNREETYHVDMAP